MQVRVALLGVVLACLAGGAAAQLYRWTDETGRVHITDTPPPASAKNVQKKAAPKASEGVGAQQPYELAAAMKDFPVTLYTAPKCGELCAQARAHLNKRGVPFREVQVWDRKGQDELRKFSSGDNVPVLVVGRSVHEGFQQEAYDALLDAARYPKTGVLPARAQAAPPLPEEYVRRTTPSGEQKAAEEPKPTGPYAPGAPPQRQQKK
jgi:glutaredoxin